MITAKEYLTNLRGKIAKDSTISEPSMEKPASCEAVEALFAEFAALYGARFADMWKHSNLSLVMQSWANALSGYKVGEVKAGLLACREKPWPPTLPEFLMLCRPSPDMEKAFADAQEQVSKRAFGEDVWYDKALYWTAVEFGFYDLRSMSWPMAKNRWSRIWAEKRQLEASLPPVPAAREVLAAPGKTLTDRETARRYLAELKRLVRGRQAGEGKGGKAGREWQAVRPEGGEPDSSGRREGT